MKFFIFCITLVLSSAVFAQKQDVRCYDKENQPVVNLVIDHAKAKGEQVTARELLRSSMTGIESSRKLKRVPGDVNESEDFFVGESYTMEYFLIVQPSSEQGVPQATFCEHDRDEGKSNCYNFECR